MSLSNDATENPIIIVFSFVFTLKNTIFEIKLVIFL